MMIRQLLTQYNSSSFALLRFLISLNFLKKKNYQKVFRIIIGYCSNRQLREKKLIKKVFSYKCSELDNKTKKNIVC